MKTIYTAYPAKNIYIIGEGFNEGSTNEFLLKDDYCNLPIYIEDIRLSGIETCGIFTIVEEKDLMDFLSKVIFYESEKTWDREKDGSIESLIHHLKDFNNSCEVIKISNFKGPIKLGYRTESEVSDIEVPEGDYILHSEEFELLEEEDDYEGVLQLPAGAVVSNEVLIYEILKLVNENKTN